MAADVWLVINTLIMRVGNFALVDAGIEPHLDVNRDGLITALDVLIIVNYLNAVAVDNGAASFASEGGAPLAPIAWQAPSPAEHSQHPNAAPELDVEDSLAEGVAEAWGLQPAALPGDREEPGEMRFFHAQLVDEALDQWLEESLGLLT